MSRKIMLFSIIVAVTAACITVVFFFLKAPTIENKEFSLTADAYYLSFNEIAGTTETSYIEKDDAKATGNTLAGSYKRLKEVDSLDDYGKEYSISISPVYIGRNVSEIDSYTKDPIPDDLNNLIYGETIYVFDKKTISFYDPSTGTYWIGRKKGEDIDITLLEELIEKNVVNVYAE